MFKRVLAVLAVPAVAAFVALGSAGIASASPTPGTTGPGSWSFDPGTGTNAIQTATTSSSKSTSTVYQAQVQQPINPNGSSVWSAKRGVIPVQFYLQQATDTKTTTTTTPAVYPDTLESDASVPYTNLGLVPAGNFTLSDVNNLTANFNWQVGHNECGTMRWQIDTPGGNVYVYYGDAGTSFQTGTGQSGDNLAQLTTAAVDDSNLVGHYSVTTWANVLAAYGSEPVNRVALITDSYDCNGTDQQVQLTGTAAVGLGTETDTYTPGTIAGSTNTVDSGLGPWANTTLPAMFIDIAQGSPSDPGTVDETTYTGVGDSSGQFAVVNGMYKYNLSNNMSAGTYNVFMTPGTDAQRIPVTNSPTGAATFVLK